MIFLSAGHHSKHSIKTDPGAIGFNGTKEGDITIEFRDLVSAELTKMKVPHILDRDRDEVLAEYLQRIKTGNGSVVLEYHCDAFNGKASGTTSFMEDDGDKLDKAFAKELVDSVSSTLSIPNRGVKTASQSNRGRLGLMNEDGIICLQELFFIDNASDLESYHKNKHTLAKAHANILVKYENLIP
jgi:N-acetylmuramoyl-L-alanine amidase